MDSVNDFVALPVIGEPHVVVDRETPVRAWASRHRALPFRNDAAVPTMARHKCERHAARNSGRKPPTARSNAQKLHQAAAAKVVIPAYDTARNHEVIQPRPIACAVGTTMPRRRPRGKQCARGELVAKARWSTVFAGATRLVSPRRSATSLWRPGQRRLRPCESPACGRP